MKRKFVLGVTAILCIAVCLLSSSLFHISEEDEALYNAYRKQTFYNNHMTSASIIELVDNGIDPPDSTTPPDPPGVTNPTVWMDVLDSVHKTWGAAGGTYKQSPTQQMVLWGEAVTVRWDCSGYIGFCLYKMGKTTNTMPITSASGWGANGPTNAAAFGCTYFDASVIDVTTDLRQGDIIFYDGHVEAFYEYSGNTGDSKATVYNWGGVNSTSKKYHDADGNLLTPEEIKNVISYGKSGYTLSQIKSVWRLN